MKNENLEKELGIIQGRLERNILRLPNLKGMDYQTVERQIRNDQHYHMKLTGNYYTTKKADRVMNDYNHAWGDSGVA